MKGTHIMETYSAGTLAGAGSFHCDSCGFTISLHELDALPECPHCQGNRFTRASIFGEQTLAEPIGSHRTTRPPWLEETRAALPPGDFIAYEAEGEVKVVDLPDGWTRVGRSLAADIRFDDPTVSRRHALLHREAGVVRILDDRSLNGVIVDGERVEWHQLSDGNELMIGRFHLYFFGLTGKRAEAVPESSEPAERGGQPSRQW